VASPIMTPRPPQRSIAGPVVLILLGVLFLLGTMGILQWHGLGTLFARFWPALLILWGVLKLIEYEQAKRLGQPARGIGVGGVFLMLFLIMAGLIATQAARVNWKSIGEHIQLGDDEGLDEIFGGSTFNYSDELSQEIPAGSSLHVNDDRGTITINVADFKTNDKTMKVSVRKKVRAEKEQDSENYNSKTKPQIVVADKVVTLNANTQGAGDKSVTTDMDIYVPLNTALVITSNRGDVTIAGMSSNVEVNHHRGEVNINDHTGNVSLNLDGSSARLGHVKGDVTIQGKANEVAVEDVDGAVHLNGEFQESVRLVRVSKTVSFRSSRTEMEFSRLNGRLDLDSGDLRADSLAGPMRLTTRSKDIALEGLSGDLRLEDSNGTVEVGLHNPGNIQIDNRKGDVRVSIPPNTPIKVEARTRQGEIESDFDEIKVDNRDRQSSASGSIGTNGPRLVMNCEKGTIEIRKGTVAVVPPAPPTPPATPGKPGKPAKALPAPKAAPVESEN
jgi:Putative adhesin